jgi:molybdenum cofactor synthesis domain-containing protein
MNLPGKYRVLVITLSDRAHKGEYEDLSGPRVMKRVEEFMKSESWEFSIDMELIPDDADKLKELVKRASGSYDIIFTTGGTGIGPRDITVDVVRPLLSKEIPGVMEYIRVKYGAEKPNALLSRGIAGLTGKSLIYTLPGSLKAVDEYMSEITRTLKHTVLMLHGIDSHSGNQ